MNKNDKGVIMDNLKKVGLTALAGSLAAVSAHAAEMTVSGATVLTYTTEDATEAVKPILVFIPNGLPVTSVSSSDV